MSVKASAIIKNTNNTASNTRNVLNLLVMVSFDLVERSHLLFVILLLLPRKRDRLVTGHDG